MDVKEKSFFQTTAGVVTGLAGILTGVVGLLTVGTQLGWIGGSGGDGDNTTATTAPADASSQSPGAAGGQTATTGRSGTGAGSGTATAAPRFTVDPQSLTFENLGPRDQQVTIENIGSSAISFDPPEITGANATQFSVANQTCGTRLAADSSCQLKVTFEPDRGGTYTATLAIQPVGASVKEVPLRGTSLLGG